MYHQNTHKRVIYKKLDGKLWPGCGTPSYSHLLVDELCNIHSKWEDVGGQNKFRIPRVYFLKSLSIFRMTKIKMLRLYCLYNFQKVFL